MSKIENPAPSPQVLAKPHTGTKVNYRGLLKSARHGLRREPGTAEMLHQFERPRWRAGSMSDLPADIVRQAQNIVLDCFPGRQTRNVKLEKAIARVILAAKEQARREALEESWQAVGAALGNETQAVQRRARSAIRSLIPAEREDK